MPIKSIPIYGTNQIIIPNVTSAGPKQTLVQDFQLDTGNAFAVSFSAEQAENLGLPNLGSGTVEGAGGLSSDYATEVDITIAGMVYKQVPGVVLLGYQGIYPLLGLPFLKMITDDVTFDFTNNTMSFLDKEVVPMPTVPENMRNMAKAAAILLGVDDENIILAQWIAENGWTWPKSNNPGNISAMGNFATLQKEHSWFMMGDSVNPNKTVNYPSPTAGVVAYVMLAKSYYSHVWEEPTPEKIFRALGDSGWAASRYALAGGLPGSALLQIYNELKGASNYTEYITPRDMMLHSIARETLGEPYLWGELAKLNPNLEVWNLIPKGTVVKVPRKKG
ncbi:MAG: hypothetical protein QXI12_06635 [Candidatus Methanomethyliaceae archaeon]